MHADDKEEQLVPYLGRTVPRRGFRAFIYHKDGGEKIAESYDEFDAFIHSDGWFATKEEVEIAKKINKKKAPKTESIKILALEPSDSVAPNHTGE